jgi:hypothetical protein
MSKNQPYKNIDKFLITERSLNYILRPVQVRKENYPYTYIIENMGSKVAVTVDRSWTSANHLILDFIGHEQFEKTYAKVYEKRTSWKNEGSQGFLMNVDNLIRYAKRDDIIPDDLKPYIQKYKRYIQLEGLVLELEELRKKDSLDEDKTKLLNQYYMERNRIADDLEYYQSELKNFRDLITGEAIQSYYIDLNLQHIAEKYSIFFRGRRKEYIKTLIRRTAEVKFTLEYPVRVPLVRHIKKGDGLLPIIKGVDLESVKVENENIFNVEFNGDSVRVIYNTLLGNIFFHNLLTLNTDWFEENYLKLDGYASAIYRRFFVTRSGNKVDTLPIKQIVDYFDWSKSSRYPEVIKSAFEDIKNAGLIADYKFNINSGKFSKGYIEVEKSSK